MFRKMEFPSASNIARVAQDALSTCLFMSCRRITVLIIVLVATAVLISADSARIALAQTSSDQAPKSEQPNTDQVRVEQDGIEFFESKIRPLLVQRCSQCHWSNSEPIGGGLRLDSQEGWRTGGDSGPAVTPGKPSESRLLTAVLYQDPTLAMPPDNALPKREIELLRQWIEMGAPDPRREDQKEVAREIDFAMARKFWSFRAISDPQPPGVKNEGWIRSPVDRFVLARIEEHQLVPAPPASRNVLIRRAFLDLLGLPPTRLEVEEFLVDESPSAWPQLVDKLLASPRYGERWGRYWLDVVRYADDQLRTEYYYRELPHAWRYRDWVIQAFNSDLPYDSFVRQQLAGDLLHGTYGVESTVGTGLLAIGMIYQADGDTPEGVALARVETLDDRVDTVTQGLLGLTVSCARCHDHKFDPIPTEDYYSLAGVFHNAKYAEDAPLADQDVVERYRQAQKGIDQIKEQIVEAEKSKSSDSERISSLRKELENKQKASPPIYPRAHAMQEGGNEDLRVALRGNPLKPGELAPRRFLRVLAGDDGPLYTEGSGRLQLANDIASPKNPLTARVIVNRIWQHHFGSGIVTSASNFGALGDHPTHAELLDWLASRLIQSGWSIKSLHREIMLSATYQLSTNSDERNELVDRGKRWLWRMNRARLDVEALRDSMLAVSGQLDRSVGGPAEADLLASYRATIYGAVHRDNKTESDELLRTFDFPNPRISSSGRNSTTLPQQQLFALNNPFVIQCARALAAQVTPLAGDKFDSEMIRQVYWQVLSREPSREELALAASFFDSHASAEAGEALTRCEQYCQVLLISNEALHRP